jgi:hypothetical protein
MVVCSLLVKCNDIECSVWLRMSLMISVGRLRQETVVRQAISSKGTILISQMIVQHVELSPD